MGQKVFKKNSMMTFEGSYPVLRAYDNCFIGTSIKDITDMRSHKSDTLCAGDSKCSFKQNNTMQSVCEFQDYCNHLYYIDDRCNCAYAWKKTAGLVLPTSTQ